MYSNNKLPYCSQSFDKGVGSEKFFNAIEKELPPVFSRETASKVIGGLISAKTMANEDCLGTGPSEKVRLGTKVGYTRESFMHWLKAKGSNW